MSPTSQPKPGHDFGYVLQLTADNSTDAQYRDVIITGVKNNVGPSGEDAVTALTRSAFLPAAQEVFTHDADGNLTAGAKWTYTWDGENRPTAVETSASAVAAGAPKQKVEFVYDGQSRRVSEKIYSWNTATSTWSLATSRRSLYNGLSLIAEIDDAGAAQRTFAWGLDLSGSLSGAGGVGGLLFASTHDSSPHSCASIYDGSGNILGYVNLASGTTVAKYEYSAFGETIVADGTAVGVFPFGFSTKYVCPLTKHIRYEFRIYDPSTGRWLNPDPIEEQGGTNLYGFAVNNPVNAFDPLGLDVEINHRVFNISGGFGPGGSLSGSVRVTAKDCCIDGRLIKNGHRKLTARIQGGLGAGIGANFNVGGYGFGLTFNLNLVNIDLTGTSESPRCGDDPAHLRLVGSFALSPVNHTYAGTLGVASGNFSITAQGGLTITADVSQYAINYRGELNATTGITGTYSLKLRPTVQYLNETTGTRKELFQGTIHF